ncbi:MAG: 4-hydroxythreonine-4-phosphate dehydrogenase PdxA [Bacteroidota bacterium]|jgi:4-hydroxythreonine-4-phosphate dehydrogenase
MDKDPQIANKEKEQSQKPLIKVGLTVGDINGIGPEVLIKALKDNRILTDIIPVIYGSNKVVSFYKKHLNLQDFNYQTCKSADEVSAKKINVVNVWQDEIEIEPGQSNADGGKYALLSLEAATKDLASGKIDVIVTAPFSKENVAKAGFEFVGHTEYLAEMSGAKEALMVLVSGSLRVALVTTHIPIKDISSKLNKELIVQKIEAFEQSLKKDFGIVKPRIAVLGLNPHAGENGKIGEEEQHIITPAIQQARQNGALAFGPYPADGFFGSKSRTQFDGVLAMYHDQGLAAFKALCFDDGVNFTASLPIVRTSPDHGTAFDIAGKQLADEQSMRSAIYLAVDAYRNRKLYKEITANPLPFSKEEKGRKEQD